MKTALAHLSTVRTQTAVRSPRLPALGIIFLAGMLFIACASQHGSGTAFPTSAATPPVGTPPVTVPTAMYATVETHVAQGMHLTVSQITTQLQADPQASLMNVGKGQGFALDQLHTLLITALQSVSDQSVRAGLWTQQQANVDMAYWNQRSPADLVNDITSWFRQH